MIAKSPQHGARRGPWRVLEQPDRADAVGSPRRCAPRRRGLALRAGAVLGFLALWSLASGLVVLLKLFNPIFLAGPWLVLGKVLEARRQRPALGARVGDTSKRVIIGFGTGALAALALGLPAGYFPGVRKVVEPVVEMLRPISAARDAAAVHRVDRHRRRIEDPASSPMRRFSRCSSPPCTPCNRWIRSWSGGAEPRRAAVAALRSRHPARGSAGDPDGHPPRRGIGILRHRDLGVHRGGAGARLSDQRRAELLPRAADARGGRPPRPPRVCQQRALIGLVERRWLRWERSAST